MSGPEPGTTPTPEAPQPAAPPQQPATPPPASGWAAAPAPTPIPGHAGLFYADVPNRIIAIIIDAIIVGIIGLIISLVLFSIIGPATEVKTINDPNSILGVRLETSTNWVPTIVSALFGLALSAGYYIYTWTAMRGTIGQKALGMQVGNAADGASLTMEQAIKRWLALGGVFALAQFLNPLPGLGILIALASFVWVIALLYTTATSPTKQGLHDRYAGSVVVKAARAVG
jgi:uncharacterized RDD family membrane protein YckC